MCKPLSNIRRPRRSPIKSAKYTRIQRSLRNDGINYTVTKATKRKVESASPVDSLVRQTVCRVTECKLYQLPDNSRENRAPKSLTRPSGEGRKRKKEKKVSIPVHRVKTLKIEWREIPTTRWRAASLFLRLLGPRRFPRSGFHALAAQDLYLSCALTMWQTRQRRTVVRTTLSRGKRERKNRKYQEGGETGILFKYIFS